MSARFFSEEPIDRSPGVEVRLPDAEARHFAQVMRGAAGDTVVLFDGSGWEFTAEATEVSRRGVAFTVRSAAEVDREPATSLTIGVALPKGDRQKVLVEKLTELGAARLVPLDTERSVASPSGAGLEKLRRAAIEACKQCGRNRLLVIEEPRPLGGFLAEQAEARLLLHPNAEGPAATACGAATVAVAVGPEGGFSNAEVALAAAAGWGTVSLGRSVLRIETAAIAAAAIFCAPRA